MAVSVSTAFLKESFKWSLFDRKKNLSKEIQIIILLEEFWGKTNPEDRNQQIKMKTEGGIIKHVQYFITLKLFRVHSPVILLLAGKGNGELCNGMEQSLEKPGAGWSWLFQRRLSLVCSHIGTIPSRKPKTVATVRNFFSCQIHCLRLLPSCL